MFGNAENMVYKYGRNVKNLIGEQLRDKACFLFAAYQYILRLLLTIRDSELVHTVTECSRVDAK